MWTEGSLDNLWNLLRVIADFYLAWLLLFNILKLIKANTRAVQIVKGVILIFSLNLMSELFDLTLLNKLTGEIITWGLLVLIIVFQPEIRSGLEQIGRKSVKKYSKENLNADFVHELTQTISFFSKEKTGALIVLERNINLEEFIKTGTPMQSILSDELLKTIFMLKTPLHDGAVFVRNQKIWSAGCVLPVSKQNDLPQTMGTRHRAALGISEISDCIVLVVSEETGKMSLVSKGNIHSFEKIFAFEQKLRELLEE